MNVHIVLDAVMVEVREASNPGFHRSSVRAKSTLTWMLKIPPTLQEWAFSF